MFCTTVYTVFSTHNSCIEYFLTVKNLISNQSPPDLKLGLALRLGLDLGSGYRVKAEVKSRKYFHCKVTNDPEKIFSPSTPPPPPPW